MIDTTKFSEIASIKYASFTVGALNQQHGLSD